MTRPDALAVIEFWFGELDAAGLADDRHRQRWWQSTPALDQEIADRFSSLMHQALAGDLADWSETEQGQLALVILLDQCFRNVYRRTARAFAGDARAEALALQYAQRSEHRLPLIQQIFMYMPLMHAERLSSQERSIQVFQSLADQASPAQADLFHSVLRSAHQHHDIIVRFGRFPHRNQALGRTSTEQELAWLADDAPRFGQ